MQFKKAIAIRVGLTAAGILACIVAIRLHATTTPPQQETTQAPTIVRVEPVAPKCNPFGLSDNVVYGYRQCSDVITAYVTCDDTHTYDPQHYVQERWPYFGQVISQEFVGSSLSDTRCKVFKLTVKKSDCWK